jgi:hypothetical protein
MIEGGAVWAKTLKDARKTRNIIGMDGIYSRFHAAGVP